MNRIDKKFKELKRKKQKAFIAYITAGDPDLLTTQKLIAELEKSGVDAVELGVPFSDPLADGTTIQRASERALKAAVTPAKVINLVRAARKKVRIPILLMPYYNLVHHYGVERFARDASSAGCDGVIIPDLPPDEASELIAASGKRGLAAVFLAAPTSTDERIRFIDKKTRGFLYYVSLTGVTGARKELPKSLISDLKRIRRLVKKPVCVGFGISNPRQARTVAGYADGVIVGSAIVDAIERNLGKRDLVGKVGRFVLGLVKAVKNP